MKFSGNITAKLDAKGRVALPASMRKQLDDKEVELVVRRDIYQSCLVLYPKAAWETEVESLKQRIDRWHPQQAMLLRQFMAEAEQTTLDSAGRLLLPKRLLQRASIERDVCFIGVDDRIEIWSREQREQQFLTDEDLAEALANFVAGYAKRE